MHWRRHRHTLTHTHTHTHIHTHNVYKYKYYVRPNALGYLAIRNALFNIIADHGRTAKCFEKHFVNVENKGGYLSSITSIVEPALTATLIKQDCVALLSFINFQCVFFSDFFFLTICYFVKFSHLHHALLPEL